jgi:hypothetical protein
LPAVWKQLAAKDHATTGLVLEERVYPLVGRARLITEDHATHLLLARDAPSATVTRPEPDPVQLVEDALKALREAKEKEAQRQATEALDKALINKPPHVQYGDEVCCLEDLVGVGGDVDEGEPAPAGTQIAIPSNQLAQPLRRGEADLTEVEVDDLADRPVE